MPGTDVGSPMTSPVLTKNRPIIPCSSVSHMRCLVLRSAVLLPGEVEASMFEITAANDVGSTTCQLVPPAMVLRVHFAMSGCDTAASAESCPVLTADMLLVSIPYGPICATVAVCVVLTEALSVPDLGGSQAGGHVGRVCVQS
eukprot:3486482-Rhodomonas_salina.1